jgi:riboflavin kinase/FMN adenylyltransferase
MAAQARAAGQPAVVVTFHPHPAVFLRRITEPFYLSTPETRAEWLGELGIDVVVTFPFDETTSRIPGRDFLRLLKERLGFRQLWVGYDFAMGYRRDTDVAALQRLAPELGFHLEILPAEGLEGQVISSSHIRRALQLGEIQQAARLLGRPYQVRGKVVPGDGRGRTIGIPTANLAVWERQLLPANGVYAARAWLDGQAWMAATNVGVRPTFDGRNASPRVETHLLDFDADLYGKELRLDFIARLRGEQRFESVQALVAQIQRDIHTVRELVSP